MDRRDFLAFTSAAAAAGLFIDPRESVAGLQPPAALPKLASSPWPAPFDSPPVLQNPGHDGVTVTVAVNAPCTAWVEYGLTEKLDQRADGARHGMVPFSGRVHSIRLSGLKPGARYHYRVAACPIDFAGPYKITRGEPVFSEEHTFATPDGGRGTAASFSLINDTHETINTLTAMTGLLGRHPANLRFWNGDIFNDVRTDQQIVEQVLRPVGAAYAADTPWCMVSGNHDVRGVNARSLERFIPAERRYYALRHGPVAFVVLDTGEDKPDDHKVYAGLNAFSGYRQQQAEWLKGAMSDPLWRDAPFRVAVLHIPLWGGGASDDSRNRWHALLNDGRTDLAISGHIHKYSFDGPDAAVGRRYSQLVGGGPALETATFIHATADTRTLTACVMDHTGKQLAEHGFKAT
jgi:hypothetical protein